MRQNEKRRLKPLIFGALCLIMLAVTIGCEAADTRNAFSGQERAAGCDDAVHVARISSFPAPEQESPVEPEEVSIRTGNFDPESSFMPEPDRLRQEAQPSIRFEEGISVHQGKDIASGVTPVKREIKLNPSLLMEIQQKKRLLKGLFETKLETEPKDDAIAVRFMLHNVSGETLQVYHSSGQRYDVWVSNERGEEVYRWSKDLGFTSAQIEFEMKPSEQLVFDETWDLRDNEGEPVPAGKYTIKVMVMLKLESGEFDWNELTAESIVEIL